VTHALTIRQLALTATVAGSMWVPVRAQVLRGEQVFAELIANNQTGAGGLAEYTADRIYVSQPLAEKSMRRLKAGWSLKLQRARRSLPSGKADRGGEA